MGGTWPFLVTFPFWTSAPSSTSTVFLTSRPVAFIRHHPVPKLISLNVDNRFSKTNRVARVYLLAPAHALRLLFSSRPRVLRLLIQKTLLGNAASLNLSKEEILGISLHSNPLQVANLVLPRLKMKRM